MKKVFLCAISFFISISTLFCCFASAADIAPFGLYLRNCECYIEKGNGYVTVSGYTKAYEADEVSVELELLQETEKNKWTVVWSDSITVKKSLIANYPTTDVFVESGYRYMVEATHTVTKDGVVENGYTSSKIVDMP